MPADPPTESELAFAKRWAAAQRRPVKPYQIHNGKWILLEIPQWVVFDKIDYADAEYRSAEDAWLALAHSLRKFVASLWPVIREEFVERVAKIVDDQCPSEQHARSMIAAIREMEI